MAREILFKAKRRYDGEWVEGSYIHSRQINEYAKTSPYIISYDDVLRGEMHFIDENTLCQYTGLTDKNGNKIWENDLVQIDAYSYIECEEDAFGVLEYSDAYASFGLSLEDRFARICDLQGSYTTIYEVLGNIFDNKELLGGGE